MAVLLRIGLGLGVLWVILLLAACQATSNAASDSKDSKRPTVISTTPADLASDVARNTDITAMFSEDILSTSVDSSSFTLTKLFNTGDVAGTVSFDGLNNVATFNPNADLALLTDYAVTIKTGIADLSGNPLAAQYSWSFKTRDGVWGNSEVIVTDNLSTTTNHSRIAVDSSGNALAVWQQFDGSRINIWANRYVVGSGWLVAELIETDNIGHAQFPQIAVDALGNALAVWQQSDGTRENSGLTAMLSGVDGVARHWSKTII